MGVGPNFTSQNGGNLKRDLVYNLNPNIGTRILVIKGHATVGLNREPDAIPDQIQETRLH